jgi:CRISPR-associated protein Cas2
MLLITYDISNDKVRTRFSKFIKKFGYRLQYSVYQIKHSEKILNNICTEIKMRFEREFTGADSVMIFKIAENSHNKTIKFGYAKDMDSDILFL